MRITRSTVFKTFGLLVLGLVASAAIALMSANSSRLGDWRYSAPGPEQEPPADAPVLTPYVLRYRSLAKGFGVDYLLEVHRHHELKGLLDKEEGPFVSCRSGWPFRALKSHPQLVARTSPVSLALMSEKNRELMERTMGRPLGSAGAPRVMPTGVVWPGMLANSVLFALAPVLVWQGFLVGRKRSWRARGRCARCGYNASGLDRCPECGAAL
jgi:hypothetical protein